jgi:N-acetylglucosaminyl-diphospho-decaprenol L-rhamnosyltransferase
MVSIVIVNWNSGTLLQNCIRSLLDNAVGCKIIIVDNASADSSLEFNTKAGADISIIRNERNIGFAAACNQGWQASSGAYVLFLNPDTEAYSGSIHCLERAFPMDGSVWAVGGRLVSRSGQLDAYMRPFPTIGRVARDLLLIDELCSIIRRRSYQISNDKGPIEVDQPAAACLMITREALEKIGGFDETFYPAWFEDVDLCRRIWDRGGHIRYQPAARFLHHGGYSLNRMTPQAFLECFHTNQIRYFQKHQGKRAALRVRNLIVCGLLLRSAISLAHPIAEDASRLASAKAFWNAAQRILKFDGGKS